MRAIREILSERMAIFGPDTAFFSASTVIFAGSFVVNVLNYIFTLFMGRLLSVEEFGEVASLFSLFLMITVPGAALTMLMSREAASRSIQGHALVRDLFLYLRTHVYLGAIGSWIAFLGFVPLIASLLHIAYEPLLIFSTLLPLTLLSALQSGTLQGLQEFFMLSKQNILTAIIKLSGALALVSLGLSVGGVVFALVLATAAGWWYGYTATGSVLNIEKGMTPHAESHSLAARFSTIFFTTLLVAFLSNIDVLLAKHYLSPELAGHYGALSTMGKILIYGVGAFVTVLLPLAAAAHAKGSGGEKRVLGLSLFSILLASLALWGVFSVFPTLVISVLFGARYFDIAPYLGTFTIAMSCISLSLALINYFVAVQNRTFVYVLSVGIVVQIGLIVFSHDSIGAITNMVLAGSLVLLVLLAGNYFLAPKTQTAYL